ncbi:MAG: hypothetical protein BGO41_05860 [Clostridiales bacterium 38-18]|nr:MAG: hypothetical protein BGO41_05860 [Clostridiales bacterium 38-18]
MKKVITLILSFILVISIPVFAELDTDELSHKVNVEMINYNIPGVLVTVVKEGQTFYEYALGESNILSKTMMDTDLSVVQTGSISKVITTYALLTLLEDKGIDFDAPIIDYLPATLVENPDINTLTFRNLLTHTTGIPMVKADSAYPEDPIKSLHNNFSEQAKTFFDTHIIKSIVPKDDYTIFSNVGYILAGVLIESISGERFEYYVAQNVLVPLEMTTSKNLLEKKPTLGTSLVQGYSVFGGQKTPMRQFMTKFLPSDDFLTTTQDMTKFLKLMTSENLNEDIKKAMLTRQVANNALVLGRSFGFTVVHYGQYEAFIHDGGVPGANSRMLIIPDLNLGLFITYNSNGLEAREALTNAVLSDFIENVEQKDTYTPFEISDLTKFEGAYSPVNASEDTLEKLTRIIHQIRISSDQQKLKIAGDIYEPISETVFYCKDSDNYAEFRTDKEGQLEYLIIGNTIYERTSMFESIIFSVTLLVLMGLCNLLALLTILFRWSNMKVNRIHDTPRVVLLFHSLSVSGVLVFILAISTTYDIWDVIYGINDAVNGARFFGIATLLLTAPSLIMISRAKQDFRWSRLSIGIYQIQSVLGVLMVLWMYLYNLI